MLTEAVIAVAAAGGTSVVQAAGTDAWASFRRRFAALMGRGDAQRAEAELVRLDRTAAAITTAEPEQLERVRTLQEGSWQTRLESWFEAASAEEREQAVQELTSIITEISKSVAPSTVTYNGDVRQSAKASGNGRVYQLGQGEMRIPD